MCDVKKDARSDASFSAGQIEAIGSAFDLLFARLREASQRFQTGDDAGRDGAIHALESVIKFLSLFDSVKAEALHAPLARLFTDLMALNDGTCSAMLRPSPRSGRAPASSAYEVLKGIAAFTVRRLEATGMGPTDARKIVAARLIKLKVRPARKGSTGGSGRISERTLRGWQEGIDVDMGYHTTAAQTLREAEQAHCNEVLMGMGLSTVPEGSTPDTLLLSRYSISEIQRCYLDRLASFIETTRTAETT